MNRRFCCILLILALGMCIACLPAEAAHSGPSGPASSNGGDTGAANTATESADDRSAPVMMHGEAGAPPLSIPAG
jgi:hypothetical protein